MNPLQSGLLVILVVFALLWLRSPRNPALAIRFGRAVVLGLASVAVLAPFVWLLAAVFKDRTVLNEYMFFPPISEWSTKTMNLENFRRLFQGRPSLQGRIYFWQYVLNSTVLATVSTTAQLFFSSLAGYALAKFDFVGKKVLMSYMLGSMMIPGVLLLAPIYAMAVKFNLVDSLFGLMLPGLVTAYGIFLFRQACIAIPSELIEAGRIDGASEFGIYFKLVMPLVRPMSAAFCLVSFLGNWNSFFSPNVFLHSQDKLTLPVVLNLYITQYENEYGVFLAGTALAMLPPAVLFFALQREFISGLTSGAVKG
jgi:ABC-type glycerol-3-phosphate transport system permease component